MVSADYPEVGELVLATVKKLLPYGAFLSMDEYPGRDGFLHVSQVSSGWVRNIREHLKEGQRLVVKVSQIDKEKQQIDLSLKQVSEADRKRKLEVTQSEKKASKLLEIAAVKLKKKPASAWSEAGETLVKEFGSIPAALEAIREGGAKTALSAEWVAALKEVAEKEYKPKVLQVRAEISLKCLDGDGMEKVRAILLMVEKMSSPKAVVELHYVGAPNYFLDVSGEDYKTIEKTISRIDAAISEAVKGGAYDYSLQTKK